MSKWLRIGAGNKCINTDALSQIYTINKSVVYELNGKELISEQFNSTHERDERYVSVLKTLDMLQPKVGYPGEKKV